MKLTTLKSNRISKIYKAFGRRKIHTEFGREISGWKTTCSKKEREIGVYVKGF